MSHPLGPNHLSPESLVLKSSTCVSVKDWQRNNGNVFAQNRYDSITLMASTRNRLRNIPFDHLCQWLPTLTFSLQIYNLSFCYRLQRSFCKVTFFSRVCDSVHSGEGVSLRETSPWTKTLDRDPSWTETPPGQRPPPEQRPPLRYASYCNAFLLIKATCFFHAVPMTSWV